MKLFYTDSFVLPLPEWHRFPMAKYARLRHRLLEQSIVGPDELHLPPAATPEQLRLVHEAEYLERALHGTLRPEEVRELGFPWSPQLVERSRRSCGATIEACRVALEGPDWIAVNLAGGTHHASANKGAGYCLFNDAAVAARVMQAEGRVERIVVIDCDVHQGDGTASIFAEDASVFTFSIHGERNYPLRKPPSDLDVGLPDGADDETYLRALEPALDLAIERARAGLAIYLAGADPYERDTLGRLKVTREGLSARDWMVFSRCAQAQLPVAVVMAGGYSKDVEDIVDIHAETVRLATQWVRSHPRSGRPGSDQNGPRLDGPTPGSIS